MHVVWFSLVVSVYDILPGQGDVSLRLKLEDSKYVMIKKYIYITDIYLIFRCLALQIAVLYKTSTES